MTLRAEAALVRLLPWIAFAGVGRLAEVHLRGDATVQSLSSFTKYGGETRFPDPTPPVQTMLVTFTSRSSGAVGRAGARGEAVDVREPLSRRRSVVAGAPRARIALDEIGRRLCADLVERPALRRSDVGLRHEDDDARAVAVRVVGVKRDLRVVGDRGVRHPGRVREGGPSIRRVLLEFLDPERDLRAVTRVVDEDGVHEVRVDLGNREGQEARLLLDAVDLQSGVCLDVGADAEPGEELRGVKVRRLHVERARRAGGAGAVVADRIDRRPVTSGGRRRRISGGPVALAVERHTDVSRRLNLLVPGGRIARRVPRVRKRRIRDGEVGGRRIEEAGAEARCRGERSRVDLRLEVALVDVPVSDVEHDRAEPEEDRQQHREENDHLAALPPEVRRARLHEHATSPVMSPPLVGSCVCSSRIVAFALRSSEPAPRIGSKLNVLLIWTRTGSPVSFVPSG